MSFSSSRIILASSSGILLGISLPKVGLWWCAWFALVPLFMALRALSWQDAFRIGFVAGLVHFLIVMNWLVFVLKMYAGMNWLECLSLFFLFSFYLALYPAFFAVIISYMPRSPYELLLIAPTSWVVLEFFRGILFTGFPWAYIGYSQFEQLHIVQISDLFGVYGVSFLLVIFNATIYILILFLSGRRWRDCVVNVKILFNCFLFVSLLLLLTIGYGFWRIADIEERISGSERLKIGIIQGNIDQSVKWDPAFQIATTKKYIKLSKLLSADSPDLVVWPETATPFYFGCSPELTEFVIEAVKSIRSDFVIGSPSVLSNSASDSSLHYNSAYLVSSDGEIKGRYDKSHLVPFGEYFPLRKIVSFFGNFLLQPHDFKAGIPGNVLLWRSHYNQLGLQICYEIVFPTLSRLMVINGAGLLLNLTNDAWFGDTAATYQHFSMSVFRAIENRRSLVRAANTGISSFVDPTGKILAKTSTFSDEVLINKLPILNFKTIYTRLGDSFVFLCLGIVAVVFFRSRTTS